MKHKLTTAAASAALIFSASVAVAQQEPARGANDFVGSDTFDGIMLALFETHGVTAGPTGIGNTRDNYLGLGSSTGERQMEGAAEEDEPECGAPGAANTAHPGCQEISPMSRMMDSSICNDAESQFAEGIAVCNDGLAVFTDNRSMRGDNAAACAAWVAGGYAASENEDGNDFVGNVGELGRAGNVALPGGGSYQVGGGGMPAWKDVLRVVYTGCQNDEGDCVGAIARRQRCDDPVRHAIVNNWNNIVDGVNCPDTNCPNGLRRAFRRDDNSGTTGVFLGFLGVAEDALASRPDLTADSFNCLVNPQLCCEGTGVGIVPIPENHSFCDGGQNENYLPDCHADSGVIRHGGDPIRKPCAPEDDLCDSRKQGGLVQAVVSTPAEADAFADAQSTAGEFRLQPLFVNPLVGLNVCPDGTKPIAGVSCGLPLYTGGPTTRNVMSAELNAQASAPGADGRSYNAVRRAADGTIARVGNSPVTPSWRMNSYVADNDNFFGRLTPGFLITAAEEVCVEGSATRQIGCVVGATTCSIGYAGREAVFAPGEVSASADNEPFKLAGVAPRDDDIAGYPASRALYVNAIGGFENISADCAARGENAQWCADQLAIANQFYADLDGADADNIGDTTQACLAAGYIPRTAASRQCVGAAGNAGCGQPVAQPYAACQPN